MTIFDHALSNNFSWHWIELKNLNLYNGDTSNYYGNDAILTIAKRLAKHTNDGINYSNGFEYYSNIMVIENLLNKITN